MPTANKTLQEALLELDSNSVQIQGAIDILDSYFEDIFSWLLKCEDIFGFEKLSGYGQTRIYGFLAERFMPYWFKKNANVATMPIIFYDIKKDFN